MSTTKAIAGALPDLPDVGYSSRKQKEGSDMIMLFMREVERHRFQLLTIVIEGKDKWRKVAGKIWRGSEIDTDALDSIYFYFTLQAVGPKHQVQLLKARQNPAKVRDLMREILPALEVQREHVRLLDKWKV